MTSIHVEAVPIYKDNYVWLIFVGDRTWAVDPGDHVPVLTALQEHGRRLDGILVTHGHWDHVTGIGALVDACSTSGIRLPVYGSPLCRTAPIDCRVAEGDVIDLGGISAQVWETPGHTLDHISFYLTDADRLFCGDTLFAGGCGRLFDGTMEQLYHSLQRIAALPAATKIHCTHEYTLANLEFALTVEPTSVALHQTYAQCVAKRRVGKATLPTDLATELATNPFLRTRETSVREAIKKSTSLQTDDDFLIFSELRMWKNRY